MKTVRLCAVSAVAALALIAAGPAAPQSSDNANCVGQLASERGTSDGQAFGAQTAAAAQERQPFGQTSVSPLTQEPRDACPSIPSP